MKKVVLFLSLAAIMVSCTQKTQNKVEAEPAKAVETEAGKMLKVDTALSKIFWIGYKPGGSHHGTVSLKSGEISVEGSELKGGRFVFDMNSIVDEDLQDAKTNAQLVNHLKSPDFFDVQKYPEGIFEITQVDEVSYLNDTLTLRISGNLELKGVSKNITFNANVVQRGGEYHAESPIFTIDRTQWGVNYGSKNIFKDIKDKFINDDMEIGLVVVAKEN